VEKVYWICCSHSSSAFGWGWQTYSLALLNPFYLSSMASLPAMTMVVKPHLNRKCKTWRCSIFITVPLRNNGQHEKSQTLHTYFTITLYITLHPGRLHLGIYCHIYFKFHSENLQFMLHYIK
jgi:hypothetical protein